MAGFEAQPIELITTQHDTAGRVCPPPTNGIVHVRMLKLSVPRAVVVDCSQIDRPGTMRRASAPDGARSIRNRVAAAAATVCHGRRRLDWGGCGGRDIGSWGDSRPGESGEAGAALCAVLLGWPPGPRRFCWGVGSVMESACGSVNHPLKSTPGWIE